MEETREVREAVRQMSPRDVDINVYQHKKTLAECMLNLALLSANANQLRYILESESTHPYYLSSIVKISISFVLQMAVIILLMLNSRYNINKSQECRRKANRINNYTIIVVVLIAIVNGLLSSFNITNGKH